MDDWSMEELVTTPQSGESVLSHRVFIHYRSTWPETANASKLFVVYIHGLGAHGNRPPQRALGEMLRNLGYGFVTIDLHGHGYSNGVPRRTLHSAQHAVDDVLNVLVHLMLHSTAAQTMNKFVLCGHSIGAAVALLVGEVLEYGICAATQSDVFHENADLFQTKIRRMFGGYVTIAPFVCAPNFVTRMAAGVFGFVLATFFRTAAGKYWDEKTWTSDAYRQYVARDRGGSAFLDGASENWNECRVMCDLGARAKSVVSARFKPLLVLYDVEDVISGHATVAIGVHVQSIYVERGLHDVLANRFLVTAAEIVAWLEGTF